MKRYDKYKQTGTPWIGKIPSHWESKRLRFVCEFRNGYTPSKANPDFWTDGTIPWYRMEDIRDSGRHLKEAKQYVTEDAVKGGGLFDAGSFILATTATIGEHAVLIVDSLANQQFTNLKIRKSLNTVIDNEFFFYFLYVIDDYCKSTTKTATFAAVNIDDLKNFEVAIPPLQEQHRIVNYINNAISTYDAVISTQERRIALLEELKQSVITEAVTHGVNPNATLRPSGIDWIGDIPQHWNINRLKYIALINPIINRKIDDNREVSYTPMDHLRYDDIIEDSILWGERSSGLNTYQDNCILMARVTPCFENGNIAIAKNTINNIGLCSSELIVFKAFRINTRFLFYILQHSKLKAMYKHSMRGTGGLKRIEPETINSTYVPIPSEKEQQQIVEALDSKCSSINASIAKAKREIELLKELKQSVITEAVTGKIKVY